MESNEANKMLMMERREVDKVLLSSNAINT